MDDKLIQEQTIADILIRLSALENVLISSGLINSDQLLNKQKELLELLVRSVLKNSNVENIDQALEDLVKK